MNVREANLQKYANLILQVGIHLQPGQTLVIRSTIESAPFVRMLMQTAYDLGAGYVYVDWSDESATRIHLASAPDAALQRFPLWKARGLEEMAREGAAFLTIYAPNPDLLEGIDPARIATANKAASLAMEPFNHFTRSGQVSWAMASVPSQAWAAKTFPELPEEARTNALWQEIFRVTRVTADNPVAAWQKHIADLRSRLDALNSRKWTALHFTAPGTDLHVELPERHVWNGGGLTNASGTFFVPNLPTEEVFTLPSKNGVNGTVRSTKPLNYNGNLVDDFSLTFRNGRIVDFAAKKGADTLQRLLDTDDGARYLGEVALVPHDSPVSNANRIFYNTLFDENASCHLAIGHAYPFCLEGGTAMTPEERARQGANTSLAHVDFMIGSAEMNIDGIAADGTRHALFRNGNWVETNR